MLKLLIYTDSACCTFVVIALVSVHLEWTICYFAVSGFAEIVMQEHQRYLR